MYDFLGSTFLLDSRIKFAWKGPPSWFDSVIWEEFTIQNIVFLISKVECFHDLKYFCGEIIKFFFQVDI